MRSLTINEARFESHFQTVATIGATSDGGCNRPAFSEADCLVREWFERTTKDSGFKYAIDGAGNQFARLECGSPNAKLLLVGSHLDTVPNGGKFDGSLGVLSGLEILQTIHEAKLRLPADLAIVNFSDEEGAHIGLLGSRAFCGLLKEEDLQNPQMGTEVFKEGLKRVGISVESILAARGTQTEIAGYLELHVEQGPILATTGEDLGLVTSIVGVRRHRLVFNGKADHAGTTPMPNRRDAGKGACRFVVSAWEKVVTHFPECVVNIGSIEFEPGVANVVPKTARLILEFRTPSQDLLDRLEESLLTLARDIAKENQLDLSTKAAGRIEPVELDSQVQESLRDAWGPSGLRSQSMRSGAFHDVQSMAYVCPAGLIFVPSVEGASHCPEEYTHWKDCVNGANALLSGVLQLANRLGAT